MSCKTDNTYIQPFPQGRLLAQNLNLPFSQLKQRLIDVKDSTYCYIVDTIKNQNGNLVQIGSAPNFQGDRITLCTCKHFMRTFRHVEDWKGVWIAGFTGVEAGGRRNALVYLMKVAHAFESHHDLWFSQAISERTKQAKSTSRHRLGDIIQPASAPGDPFDPQSYLLPRHDHSHFANNDWYKDVDYLGRGGRRPALLVGEVMHSFLWNKPTIFASFRLHRGQEKHNLGSSRKIMIPKLSWEGTNKNKPLF